MALSTPRSFGCSKPAASEILGVHYDCVTLTERCILSFKTKFVEGKEVQ
jgi:hypothetical protein